ncbi:glutathione S-transferase C-terminal domain-containing protein [Pantoea eucrina]|uniref:glutathione S-transferase C-terminal domain-containing protein n=1 Tax=Pantoea eucrina TaxID=472693 RepID=UPI000A249F33|nr:glutathione S-transferase C-terminal domain-containing protein [Pantoea eucrina]ORM78872.1 glutathione-dependent reductase [Pantoea eucrina]
MAVLENGVWNPQKDVSELTHTDILSEDILPEAGRYHLYVSRACPFAHRPWLVIAVLGLDHAIGVSSVAARRYDKGWEFDVVNQDSINGSATLADIYVQSKPDYSGSVTVPVMFDRQSGHVASTDSASLALTLATEWKSLGQRPLTLVPAELRQEAESLNEWLHVNVNRRVYQVGFAKQQSEYDSACEALFSAFDELENRMRTGLYLMGDTLTLPDLFLLPTLVRFEAVYALHFKANTRSLTQMPHLYDYMLRMLDVPGVRDTIDMEHIKLHYYFSHRHINPTGIVPAGPCLSWLTPQ